MTVLGIDYSFTCPALCYIGDESPEWWVNYKLKGKPYQPLPRVNWTTSTIEGEVPRFLELAFWVAGVVATTTPDLITIEDFAYMANGRITQLAENMGVLKAMLYTSYPGIPVQLVAPTAMKKLATGKGNANKDDVWAALIEVLPETEAWAAHCHPKAQRIGSPCADIADSYFLAQYGRQQLR